MMLVYPFILLNAKFLKCMMKCIVSCLWLIALNSPELTEKAGEKRKENPMAFHLANTVEFALTFLSAIAE